MFVEIIKGKRVSRYLLTMASGILVLLLSIAYAADTNSVSIDMGGGGASSRSITLGLDKAAIIELPSGVAEIVVSQPEVATAKPLKPRRIYILGVQIGQTNAFFFDASGNQILNLEINVERDLDTLHSLLDRLIPSSRIRAEAVNDNIILRGSVDNLVDADTAKSVAQRFIGENEKVLSLVSIRERGQVMLKVRIAEMQRNLIKQIGINTEGFDTVPNSPDSFSISNSFSVAGQPLGAFDGSANISGFAGLSDLNVRLRAFEREGLMKTLAEPNLTAVSGESATFLAGGEFPVPVSGSDGEVVIEFKPFGVALGFSPVVLSKGRISMKVKTEVSELNQSAGFTLPGRVQVNVDTGAATSSPTLSIPGLSLRRAETSVELPSGGSIAMAGLLQEDIRSVFEGVPGAKDIPVLGQLFKSTEFLRDESELVIIITPYLVESTSAENLIDPASRHVSPSTSELFLFNRLESKYGLNSHASKPGQASGVDGFIID